ncbi:MAG TPA: hypothetical protein VFR86_23405 [Burkholderiaceae bacterium]|nr:hypothetical protein [Burkholderiaceae bacterium]
MLNLFDRDVSDIEYFYESQLAGETRPWPIGISTRPSRAPCA